MSPRMRAGIVEPGLAREVARPVIGAGQQRAIGLAVAAVLARQLLLGGMAEVDGAGLVAIGALERRGVALAGEQLLQRDLATALQGDRAVLELEQGLGLGDERLAQLAALGRAIDGLGTDRVGGEDQAGGGEGGGGPATPGQKVMQQSSHLQTRCTKSSPMPGSTRSSPQVKVLSPMACRPLASGRG